MSEHACDDRQNRRPALGFVRGGVPRPAVGADPCGRRPGMSPLAIQATMLQDASAAGPAGAVPRRIAVGLRPLRLLSLLASTGQTGELEVVGEAVDGRVWLDGGELSDAQVGGDDHHRPGRLRPGLRDRRLVLLHLRDGPTRVPSPPCRSRSSSTKSVPRSTSGGSSRRRSRSKRSSPSARTPPGEDVQIRGDQWQVLATIGTTGSRCVGARQIGGDQIVGLRTLRDLHVAGLIVLLEPEERDTTWSGPVAVVPDFDAFAALPTAPVRLPPGGTMPSTRTASALPPPSAEPATASPEEHQDGLAEVAIMPPPIADDPWTPITEPHDSGIA